MTNSFPIFSRHETFHPRYGWLKKGFDKATVDNSVFLKEDAPVILGVGKNMARAIRYWCTAFKVLWEGTTSNGKKARIDIPTEFGKKLLGNDGWDPYLEDTASIWLLHWKLLTSPCYAAAWYFAFCVFRKVEFTQEELLRSLKEFNEQNFPTMAVADSSLIKDINCLLRMYVPHFASKGPIEDTLNCPFNELNIIIPAGDSKHFAFNVGSKSNLPEEIIVSACLKFASNHGNDAKTFSISRLLYDLSSPGLAFRLTENALCSAIEKVSSNFSEITLSETAGLIQFSYNKDPDILSEKLLEIYYQNKQSYVAVQ